MNDWKTQNNNGLNKQITLFHIWILEAGDQGWQGNLDAGGPPRPPFSSSAPKSKMAASELQGAG